MRSIKILNLNNYQPVFKANLYDQGEKVEKSVFNPIDIAKLGNEDTDIFVKSFESYDSVHDQYNHNIAFTVSNPLLGSSAFKRFDIKTTVTKADDDEFARRDVIYQYFQKVGLIEQLENAVLKDTLLKKINNNAAYNCSHIDQRPTNPEVVLNEMLSENNFREYGFSDSRIDDFKHVAENLKNEIVKSFFSNRV